MRVLFVDDERRVLDGLRRALHGAADDWSMSFVDSGREAMRAISREPFDVVVTDLAMPDVNGVTLLKFVARVSPTAGRIVLTGQQLSPLGEEAKDVAHAILSKPANRKAVLEAIEQVKPSRTTGVQSAAPLPAAPTPSLPRVLIVDDDERILTTLTRVLRANFQVTTARGGAQALALLDHDQPFDVVVSDLRMIGMNGIELLDRVRQVSPSSARMLMTGMGIDGLDAGALDAIAPCTMIAKPFVVTDLVKQIHAASTAR